MGHTNKLVNFEIWDTIMRWWGRQDSVVENGIAYLKTESQKDTIVQLERIQCESIFIYL